MASEKIVLRETTFNQVAARCRLKPTTVEMARLHLVEGEDMRAIAKQFDVSYQRVWVAINTVVTAWRPSERDELREQLLTTVERAEVATVLKERLTSRIENVLR